MIISRWHVLIVKEQIQQKHPLNKIDHGWLLPRSKMIKMKKKNKRISSDGIGFNFACLTPVL